MFTKCLFNSVSSDELAVQEELLKPALVQKDVEKVCTCTMSCICTCNLMCACQSCSAALLCIIVSAIHSVRWVLWSERPTQKRRRRKREVWLSRRENREEKRLAIMMMTKKRRRLYEKVCLAAVTGPSQKYNFVYLQLGTAAMSQPAFEQSNTDRNRLDRECCHSHLVASLVVRLSRPVACVVLVSSDARFLAVFGTFPGPETNSSKTS